MRPGDRAWALGCAARRSALLPGGARTAPGDGPIRTLLFALGRCLVYAENAGEEELEQAVEGLLEPETR